jgi:hypothetical protein
MTLIADSDSRQPEANGFPAHLSATEKEALADFLDRARELRRDVWGLTFDSMYNFGVEVEPLVITEEQLRDLVRRELSIGAALERESVPLALADSPRGDSDARSPTS